MHRFICFFRVYFVCFCFIQHSCCIIVSTVRWTWWDRSLIFRPYLPLVLWHCWLGHLTHKNPSPIWPIMYLVGRLPCSIYLSVWLQASARWCIYMLWGKCGSDAAMWVPVHYIFLSYDTCIFCIHPLRPGCLTVLNYCLKPHCGTDP